MSPIDHAKLSVRDFQGHTSDYIAIHKYIDQTKLHYARTQHRFFLHNTLGIKICEDVFGDSVKNSEGVDIPVREIARRHIFQDCSCVPTVKECVDALMTGNINKFNKPNPLDLKWLKQQRKKKSESSLKVLKTDT